MTSLVDLLTPRYAPIRSYILSCLDIGDIVAITRTCRALTGTYSTFQALNFNIDERLKTWFQDPYAFRSIQGQCHALIADECGIGLFMRKVICPRRTVLQIYVNDDYLAPLVKYLELETYIQLKEPDILSQAGLLRFSKAPYNNDRLSQSPKVTVQYDARPAILQCFDNIWTTMMFTFISWNKAYSMFPQSTFIEHTCYVTNQRVEMIQALLDDKCSAQNVCIKAIREKEEDSVPREHDRALSGPRRVGDKHTWVLELNTTSVTVPDVPDMLLESSMFQLKARPIPPYYDAYLDHLQRPNRTYYKIACELIQHPILSDPIMTIDWKEGPYTSLHRACFKVSEKLTTQTIREVKRLPKEERDREHWLLRGGKSMHKDYWDNRFVIPSDRKVYDGEALEALMKAWDAYDEQKKHGKLSGVWQMIRAGGSTSLVTKR